jgi:hypothetical protein
MERLNLKIVQGKTFQRVVRWEKEPFLFKAITAISKTAPARLTVTGHGLTDGWRVAPVSVLGMRQINAPDPQKLRDADFHRATVIDANTVDLNTVNAAGFSTYTSGGYLQFYTPASLDGCTARLVIKNRVGGTVLVTLTHADGITLNDTAKTIAFVFEAEDSADYTWTTGVYELEIEDASGVVTGLFFGTVTVTPEVAT